LPGAWRFAKLQTPTKCDSGGRHSSMQIDSLTVMLFGLFIKAVLGGLFVVFWYKQRDATWYAWWSGTFFLGCIATLAFVAGGLPLEPIAVGLGNVALIAAFATCWQGARAFNRQPALWLPVFAAPALWLAACFIPTFLETVSYRIVLSSLILGTLLALSAFEFWRGREERLPSRWPVIILFSTFALCFGARIFTIGLLPFPFGAQPMQPGSIGAFNLLLFVHALLLTVLIVAMSKERLELEQWLKAQTDPLTGVLNRRALMTRGTRLLQRHSVQGAPLCLLFLDLDHFKSFNDRFGHSGGDDVLLKFVTVVNANIRPTDFLFRIGGEEFCCLLPYTVAAQAQLVAERVRYQFAMTVIDVAGTPVKATVSLGIASTESFGYDLDTLMRRADMAVYAAKQQGRNKVVVAAPASDPAAPVRIAAAAG
jgi:diguanylate cyclase (GGDEF)-like protein